MRPSVLQNHHPEEHRATRTASPCLFSRPLRIHRKSTAAEFSTYKCLNYQGGSMVSPWQNNANACKSHPAGRADWRLLSCQGGIPGLLGLAELGVLQQPQE